MKILPMILCIIVLITGIVISPQFKNKENKFWHIEKHDNIYWFISPEQKKVFLLGVTSVHPFQYGISEPHYISKDFIDNNNNEWAIKTSNKIKLLGFTNVGAWNSEYIRPHISYTLDLNLTLHTSRKISDSLWEKDIEKAISEQVKPNDINLIGYYTDNELNWENLEKDAKKYFEVVHRLIKKYDPNHLILGVRFNNRPPISVLKASIGKVDVHSYNIYSDNGILWKNMFTETHEITKCPIIISEYSFFSKENNSNNPNVFTNSGLKLFGGLVENQKERAKLYDEFTRALIDCSFIVGAEWFQWNDEPTSGRRTDSESFNFGIVDVNDNLYKEIANSIKILSSKAEQLHSKSTDKLDGPLWKDDIKRIY